MTDLNPYLRLDIALDRDVYGVVLTPPQTLTWNLAGLLGRPDTAFAGFVPDPTGQYLIQQPGPPIPLPAGPSAWTLDGARPLPAPSAAATAPTGGSYTYGTDRGQPFLRVLCPPGQVAPAVLTPAHDDDEGMRLEINRSEPVVALGASPPTGAAHNLYIELNWGRDAGLTGLRLAVEAGSPIRLETSDDDVTWTTADVASGLGESEAYLKGRTRDLAIDVVPLTSAAFYDDQDAQVPPSTDGHPVDLVAVAIGGGDAVLTYKADGARFPAGHIRVTGTNGQWSVKPFLSRSVPLASASLPEQQRLRPFRTQPQGRVNGFFPDGQDAAVLTGTLTSQTAAAARLTLTTPPESLDTQPLVLALMPGGNAVPAGGAIRTAVLASATLDFPGIFRGPVALPEVVSYFPFRADERALFRQQVFGVDRSAAVHFSDEGYRLLTGGTLAPGAGVLPAVRAAALVRGLTTEDGYDDTQAGFWGFWGMGRPSFRWYWQDGLRCLAVTIAGGWRENVCVLWMEEWDGECQYAIMRELGYRMGLTDERMPFPYCLRGSDCPHYHLPSGTLAAPLFRPPPGMTVPAAMRLLRENSGERDPLSGQVLPMYLFFDRLNNLQFFPMPVGLLNIFVDPSYDPVLAGLSQSKVYQIVPSLTDGQPNLDEFVRGTLESAATLDNIRTDVVLAGQRPTDGAFVTAFASNPSLGADGDPGTAGYVGVQTPYVDINRLYASPEAVEVALANAVAQTSFPAITTDFTAHFQSGLDCLDTVGVLDPYTQGTDQPVPYYVAGTASTLAQTGAIWEEQTLVSGHLLGQAGD